jgi:hypothetical protein
MERPSEGQLDGASDLTTVDFQAHNRAEGANIVEVGAHPPAGLDLISVFLLFRILLDGVICTLVDRVKDTLLWPSLGLEVNRVTRLVAVAVGFRSDDVIPNFPFKATVGDETLKRLRIDARQVAGVWVTVWVAVLYVEQVEEVVSVLNAHSFGSVLG